MCPPNRTREALYGGPAGGGMSEAALIGAVRASVSSTGERARDEHDLHTAARVQDLGPVIPRGARLSGRLPVGAVLLAHLGAFPFAVRDAGLRARRWWIERELQLRAVRSRLRHDVTVHLVQPGCE